MYMYTIHTRHAKAVQLNQHQSQSKLKPEAEKTTKHTLVDEQVPCAAAAKLPAVALGAAPDQI